MLVLPRQVAGLPRVPTAVVTAWLLLALATGLSPARVTAQAADLAAARALYAAASYEEALAALASLDASRNVEQSQQLRALCLLALGRTDEARKAIAALVEHNPLYTLPPGEVSPKLESLFHEVRRETLPGAARALYAQARARYDARQWAPAREQFSRLLTLLADPDASSAQSSLSDLKQLGEGFLKLTESELAAEERRVRDAATREAAARAAEETARAEQAAARAEAERLEREKVAAAAATEVATAGTGSPVRAGGPRSNAPIYSAADVDVTRPVELRRVMPRWIPPTREMAATSHTGLLELVIDEAGSVAEARVAKPIAPAYDQALRDIARTWRYRPAMKDGQPVRYRIVLEVVLKQLE